jgi:hypothetical protein
MKVILESEGQDAFILEDEVDRCYLLDRRVMRRFGPAPASSFTRHGRWRPFSGPSDRVLELFDNAEDAPLGG